MAGTLGRLRGDLERARGLLGKLLPYAGESYDAMTSAQAKDCESTVTEVAAFLAPPTPTASPEPDRASPEVTVKEPR